MATVNYGSGDTTAGAGLWKYASVPTRPGSAPATSATVLVTGYSYDSKSARRTLVTDPAGTETRTFFDDLGRTTWIAENYDDWAYNPEFFQQLNCCIAMTFTRIPRNVILS